MKVNILYKDTDLTVEKAGLQIVTDKFNSIGFPFSYILTPTNTQFTPYQTISSDKVRITVANPTQVLQENKLACDIVCLLSNSGDRPITLDLLLNGATPIQIPHNWYATFPESFAEFFIHEITHALYIMAHRKGATLPDKVHDMDFHPEFKLHIDYFLSLITQLKPYWPMQKLFMVSDTCINLIKSFEGFSSKPYKDPVGRITIGYGTTYDCFGKKITLSHPSITKEQATTFLKNFVNDYAVQVQKYIKVSLTQNQLDALVSCAYNIGIGNFSKSKLLENVNNKCLTREYFTTHWIKGGGKVLRGLVNRRAAEADLYFKA
jgi:lysozyme